VNNLKFYIEIRFGQVLFVFYHVGKVYDWSYPFVINKSAYEFFVSMSLLEIGL
jgi:hypothetical protein